jgi:succinylglutamate desuccinylase
MEQHGQADGSSGGPPRRVLGRVPGARPGATLVVLAGIHGNEPAGLAAVARVLARLERGGELAAGEVVFLAGNLRALGRDVRFIDLDLNRQWGRQSLEALAGPASAAAEPAERAEQRQLAAELERIVARARGPLYFVDLHTSSADGPPFVTIGDTLRNRRFARALPLPLILGLEEQIDGALLEFLGEQGFVTLGVEGGGHRTEHAVDCLESVLWFALSGAGLLHAAPSFLDPHRARLRRASRGVPPVIEVRHRHAIAADDRFEMRPGFRNFDPVCRGQVLAGDRHGDVRAPEDGLMLLPLYQGLGNDGYFLAREVRGFWLRLSAILRRMRAGALMRYAPGVSVHPGQPETLLVDTRVARWYPLQVFHLLGFRKLRRRGTMLLVGRRRFDLAAPPRIDLG